MGSNMAENHPVGFQWVMEARERGAKVIHVDPRFTRTSAMATKWVGIRAGSDIAFLGGIVNYILEHDRWFEEYVKHYTNAPVIIDEDFARHRGPRRALLRLGPGEAASTTRRPGSTRGWTSHGAAGEREQGFDTSGEQSGHGGHGGGLSTASRRRRTRRSSTRAASSSC